MMGSEGTQVETRTTRVVVVEDHALVRESLVRTVNFEDGFEVVGEATRGDKAVAEVTRRQPDIVMMDISMPGGSGLDVASHLKKVAPRTRIVFVTMHEDDVSIAGAVSIGVEGYVLKSASTDELLRALHAVAAGNSYLSAEITSRVIDLATGRDTHALTKRELEILDLLSRGVRPVEVGRKLFVSLKTVKNHLTRAREEFRYAVTQVVSDYVGTERDLSTEIRDLFGL
jgi:DNA-binding NarL/FixJ family response regulator